MSYYDASAITNIRYVRSIELPVRIALTIHLNNAIAGAGEYPRKVTSSQLLYKFQANSLIEKYRVRRLLKPVGSCNRRGIPLFHLSVNPRRESIECDSESSILREARREMFNVKPMYSYIDNGKAILPEGGKREERGTVSHGVL